MKVDVFNYDSSHRNYIFFRFAILSIAAILILVYLMRPSVDFDEGFFFQTAVRATTTGVPSFPWTDVYFKHKVPYIPLNSLLPAVNWVLAHLSSQRWLFAARLLSVAAVVAALAFLAFSVRPPEKEKTGPYLLMAFVISCLPLWLVARQVRPEAVLFLFFVGAFLLAQKDGLWPAFACGILAGLCLLTHAIHGVLISILLVSWVVIDAGVETRSRHLRMTALISGAFLPVVTFYGVYSAKVGTGEAWRQIMLFVSLTPRNVISADPYHQILAWLSHIRGQLNLVPLLGVAALSIIAPVGASRIEVRRTRFLQIAVVVFLIFWIFIYPRKSFSPVIILLPIIFNILIKARGGKRWRRFGLTGLGICLVANLMLSLRYHWRLARSKSGLEELAPIVAELDREHVLDRKAGVMAKLWLVFAVPSDTTIWDITVWPTVAPKEQDLETIFSPLDAVVTECDGDQCADKEQGAIAAYCRRHTWREVKVSTTHYFQPLDLVVFTPPGVVSNASE